MTKKKLKKNNSLPLSEANDELISAEDLLKMIKRAERDYKEGKVYKNRV